MYVTIAKILYQENPNQKTKLIGTDCLVDEFLNHFQV